MSLHSKLRKVAKMKKSLLFGWLLGLLVSCDLVPGGRGFSSINDSTGADLDYVFDMSAVPRLVIRVSTNQWNTLLTNFDTYSRNEQMVRADFIFDKDGRQVMVNNIGFRMRGNTSLSRPAISLDTNTWSVIPFGLHHEQYYLYISGHFKISFNEFVPGQRLYGLRNLTLKFFNNDPLYAREVYGYDLNRRFGIWATPRISYARLYVEFAETGESVYYGPYMMIETVDREFIQSRFPDSPDGFLWKCLYQSYPPDMHAATPADAFGVEINTLSNSWTPTYDLKTRKDELAAGRAQFMNFIQQLNSFTPGSAALKVWLEENFEVEQFLRALAVGTQLGHWDSLWNLRNNYYFYFDNYGKAFFIPYDHDNVLGTGVTNFANPATYDVAALTNTGPVLCDQILSIPVYRLAYFGYLSDLIDHKQEYFDLTASTNRIRQWQDLISPYLSGIDAVPESKNNGFVISDNTAPWGHFDDFRVFTGDESGDGTNGTECNYFKSRSQFTAQQLGLPHRTWSVYRHDYSQMYFTGSWPGLDWTNSLRMELVADHTWQITMTNTMPTNWFKFKTHQYNWTYDEWGDANHDGVGELHEYYSPETTNLGIVTYIFNERTLQYTPFR